MTLCIKIKMLFGISPTSNSTWCDNWYLSHTKVDALPYNNGTISTECKQAIYKQTQQWRFSLFTNVSLFHDNDAHYLFFFYRVTSAWTLQKSKLFVNPDDSLQRLQMRLHC